MSHVINDANEYAIDDVDSMPQLVVFLNEKINVLKSTANASTSLPREPHTPWTPVEHDANFTRIFVVSDTDKDLDALTGLFRM